MRRGPLRMSTPRAESLPKPEEPPRRPARPSPSGRGRVIELDPAVDPRWEALVAAHPEGSIYHHPAWLRALELEYGQRPVGLAYQGDRGEIRGVLPLLQTRGLPFLGGDRRAGRRLASLPRTPVAGPLALDAEATTALVVEAIERVRESDDNRLEIKMASPGLADLVPPLGEVRWRPNYRLDLPARPDQIRFGNARDNGRITWSIRHARKAGVEVHAADSVRELRSWYRLYLETMRHHVVPPRPFRFFEGLWQVLRPRGLMRLLVAEQRRGGRREMLAGSILLMFGRTVFYAFNGRHRESLSLRPNDLIQWTAIRAACEEGFRHYDLGEVPADHEGLAKFKSKWGATESWLYRYYFPPAPPAGGGAGGPESDARELATAAWRRLPLRMTELLGNWVYRFG